MWGADGLAFDPSRRDPLRGALRAELEGFNITTKAMVFDSGTISGGPDGIALGTGPVAGNLFVNTNGGTVVEVNLATAAQTVIASGGSRGDFVTVDPNNGTLLVTQSDRLMRLIPGVFVIPPHLVTTTTTLDVTPRDSSFGQTVTLTAAVATAGTGIPTGTVTFMIDGQAQAPVTLTEVGGFDQATFTTSALMPGTDAITATYSGDATFASSGSKPVSVTVAAPPMITGEQVVMMQNKNKKGKSVGKRVLVGFTLDYNTAMNSQAAGLPAITQVTYNTTERVKKKRVPASLPVDVQPNYNPTTHIVTLTIVGKQSFAKGGQITVNSHAPGRGFQRDGCLPGRERYRFHYPTETAASGRLAGAESADTYGVSGPHGEILHGPN